MMNKYGFTLVEVIISAVILAFTVGGLLFVFSTESGVVARIGRRMQAMDFARQTSEQLKNEVRADKWPGVVGDVLFGSDTGITHTTEAFLPLGGSDLGDKFSGTREYTVTDKDADGDGTYEDDEYKQVTVTVQWTEPQ